MLTVLRDGAQVTDVIESLDTRSVFDEVQRGATEVSPADFLDVVIKERNVSFEVARDILFGLLDARRVALTPGYNLVLP